MRIGHSLEVSVHDLFKIKILNINFRFIFYSYPLMMLSWKMAACLAAGNTVVHKPAEVCPLTALKFAELALRAGIPNGVINIVTGKGKSPLNKIPNVVHQVPILNL